MPVAVRTEGLAKRFRAGIRGCCATVDALRGVDLATAEGEILGVLGPRGAGKSTLLLCIAGLLRPDAGRICWFERARASPMPPPGIAYAPERSIHYPFLTVRESLEYHATIQDLPGARGRIEEAMHASLLAGHAHHRVALLSSGIRQRLEIARTLLASPRLLLLDEPLAGLDPGSRSTSREIIRSLAARGITLIIATREMSALESLATRVVTLVGGRIRGELTRVPTGWELLEGPTSDSWLPLPMVGGGLVAEHPS